MRIRWHLAFVAFVAPWLSPATSASASREFQLRDAAIIRGSVSEKKLALVFTGHSFAEGGPLILEELDRRQAKASFFLTGDFLAATNFAPFIKALLAAHHYLGPHSDRHLLYCSWDPNPRTLVTREEFLSDLRSNLDKIVALGVPRRQVRFFLPAYEHHNRQIAEWTAAAGMTLVNYTPGTRAAADYTEEADPKFVSSQAILDSILARERQDPHGLNGYVLLMHAGSGPRRADKFHRRLGELLEQLSAKGYQFVRIDELLATP